MRTPYDGFVRLQKRAVDEVRLSISIEVGHIVQTERAQAALEAEQEAECLAAARDPMISTHGWLRARMADQARLIATRQAHEAALDHLRVQAREAYGAQRVAENAAQLYARRIEQARPARQQAEADDLSGARMLIRLRRERWATARKKRHDAAH